MCSGAPLCYIYILVVLASNNNCENTFKPTHYENESHFYYLMGRFVACLRSRVA